MGSERVVECLYDVTVLGAGVQGSSTAYYLKQKAGVEKVLLLEQVKSNVMSAYSRAIF